MIHLTRFPAVLLLATIVSLHAGEGYPEFSWDHVPVYAHLGYDANLQPEQYDFLAKHFSLVTFAAGPNRKAVERGIATGAAEIKKRNPAVKVLFYWASDIPHGPFTLSLASFPKDGYLEVLRKRPTGKGTPIFDRSREDMRAWWSDVAAKAVREYGCDGIFSDGTHPLVNRDLSAERLAAVNEGLITMLKQAHEKMGKDKLIIFNALHGEEGAEYMPVTDGAMIDNFDRTLFRPDDGNVKAPGAKELNMMAEDIQAMSKASKEGKIVIFKAWPGFHQKDSELMKRPHAELAKLACEQITFPLASFLIAAGRYSYFQYTWGWNSDCGTFDWHPEFDKPLGEPKGEAQREGWTYSREFGHASVSVDLEKKSARIDWK